MSRVNLKSLLSLQSWKCQQHLSLSNVSGSRPFPVLRDGLDTSTPEAAQALAVSQAASEELSRMKKICLEGGGPKGDVRLRDSHFIILEIFLRNREACCEEQEDAGQGSDQGDPGPWH